MIGLIGAVGRVGMAGGRRVAPAGVPDFGLSGSSVTTAWGTVAVGDLVPNAATPAGAYFVLVGEPAGLAVVNG
ncbi:hypothetical protein CAP39_10165 [Sphingomonas sp. IBVSS1]|nr:hypothetical protein CAP39_10165 [Sphingomonas sp. IBVSS1]